MQDRWNVIDDKLIFDISDICRLMKETKTDWDEPFTGGLLTGWRTLASIKSNSLQEFCDASQSAYAAVVYF